MRYILIGFAALVTASVASIAPSSAQYWEGHGTWCAAPPSDHWPTWTCYYYSQAQCRASAGRTSCVPNPATEWERRGFYVPPEVKPRAGAAEGGSESLRPSRLKNRQQ